MPISVGIDLVEIAEVREEIARHGSRYLDRVYTEAELRDCGGRPSSLAARFAVKEATIKALQVEGRVGLRDVSVELDARSRPAVVLAAEALALAARCGVDRLAVDLRVGRLRALALVLAHTNSGVL